MIKYSDLSPIDKLTESTKPVWGIMTPQHMVEHLVLAVKSSNGSLPIDKCMNPPEKFHVLKKFLLSPRQLPKNFVNSVIGDELKPLLNSNLDFAKEELLKEVMLFDQFFNNNPSASPINATFGPLNKEEWIIFHKKHFNHHFRQFDLINE
jgi:oxepin-CoA hydrolase/3-oxo-5,6-dehydrosuberyl-CoA semialdehyde dehydrogenase